MLVGSLLSMLTPYLVKGGEAFAKEAGKDSFNKLRALMGLLRSRLAGDSDASRALEQYEKHPGQYQAELGRILQARAAADPSFASQLVTLLADIESKAGGALIHVGKLSVKNETTQGNKISVRVSGGTLNWKE